MDIQALINVISDTSKRERERYQMTVGKLLDGISAADDALPVEFGGEDRGYPTHLNSYRGYYEDLAFQGGLKPISVKAFRDLLSAAIGQTFEGYKGGDFLMDRGSVVWVADYGCTGNAIMDISINPEAVVLVTRNIDLP